jgi:SAM-dependent methyltransferase
MLRIESSIIGGLVSRSERGGPVSGREPDGEARAEGEAGADPGADRPASPAVDGAGRAVSEGAPQLTPREDRPAGGDPDEATGARTADWQRWLASPPGEYVMAWEQARLDEAVGDVFGFNAVQCGEPGLEALRANRMPHRIHALRAADPLPAHAGPMLRVEHFEELPFDGQSIDLVVLPHVLEFAQDPHQVLREVDRVLRPEGRLIVTGFNPVSLWGARQLSLRGVVRPFLPREGHFIGVPRLRDWCKLLSFETERARYGCWRPPCRTRLWLDRTAFMERAGDRWWPICGAVYMVSATKRVRAMRLIGPAWKRPASARAIAVPAAQRRGLGDEG